MRICSRISYSRMAIPIRSKCRRRRRQWVQPGQTLARGLAGTRSWGRSSATTRCAVFPTGNTRTYHPVQYFPELTAGLAQRGYEGLLGGWMPAVRK